MALYTTFMMILTLVGCVFAVILMIEFSIILKIQEMYLHSLAEFHECESQRFRTFMNALEDNGITGKERDKALMKYEWLKFDDYHIDIRKAIDQNLHHPKQQLVGDYRSDGAQYLQKLLDEL